MVQVSRFTFLNKLCSRQMLLLYPKPVSLNHGMAWIDNLTAVMTDIHDFQHFLVYIFIFS